MKAKFNVRFLALVTLMLIAVVGVKAQTNAQMDYFENCKARAKQLFDKAQHYYDERVAPVYDKLNAIPPDVSPEELGAMQEDLEKSKSELASLEDLRLKSHVTLNAYLNTLLNSRCNPQAVLAMKDYDDALMRNELDLLKEYENYSLSLKDPLEALKTALESNGWRKLDENSSALQQFDKEWKKSDYIVYIDNGEGNRIPFLNECVGIVISLRIKGFDNCRSEIEQLLVDLTPTASEETSPVKYANLLASDARAVKRITELYYRIDSLNNKLKTISNTNELFNDLDKQRYEVVESWYDRREDLDKLLMDACRYTLFQPCDTMGAYMWMRSQLEPMLDSVYHKSYSAQRDRYLRLLADYDHHTKELGVFLDQMPTYVNLGSTTDDIKALLSKLDYYKNYYVKRNEEKAVSSPFLNDVISDFEQMLSPNSKVDKEKLQQLSEGLRGDPLYYETLRRDAEVRATFIHYSVNGVSFKMVNVDGGTFTMGATSEQGRDANEIEKPAHKVTLDSFEIGLTEVTQDLWQAVMGGNPSEFKDPKLPVENVSWNDCQDFIMKLNASTGEKFRLPTEAEWEYAARGGNKSHAYKYSGSNDIDFVAWYNDNSSRKTHDVAKKRSNELGLYDMSGNVGEWCYDIYSSYNSSPQTNPTGPKKGTDRVVRGGRWCDKANNCRVTGRTYWAADNSVSGFGLRLAKGDMLDPIEKQKQLEKDQKEAEKARQDSIEAARREDVKRQKEEKKRQEEERRIQQEQEKQQQAAEKKRQEEEKKRQEAEEKRQNEERKRQKAAEEKARQDSIDAAQREEEKRQKEEKQRIEAEQKRKEKAEREQQKQLEQKEKARQDSIDAAKREEEKLQKEEKKNQEAAEKRQKEEKKRQEAEEQKRQKEEKKRQEAEMKQRENDQKAAEKACQDSIKAIVHYSVKGVEFTMIKVVGGSSISSFNIGQTEVTQELWEAVMGNNPSHNKGAKHPVEQVSWEDCQEFIKKLNEETGENFRLPTEAEWEYAARGGSKSRGYWYSGSNSIDAVAWNNGNSDYHTHYVATKQSNELGIYDMNGNVWEWCQDCYGSYNSDSQINPVSLSSSSNRVIRGGSCSSSFKLSVPDRLDYEPSFRGNALGFRLAMDNNK